MSGATVQFGKLDFVVVALFLIGILALGFSARLRSNNILQFLAAGRSLSLPLFVASLVSMWYGGILGIGEAVPSYGVGTWILFGVPYYFFAIVYAFYIAPRVRRAEQLSIPERLHLRFGAKVAILGAFLMLLLAVPASHVLMLGTLVQAFTGWRLWVCVLLGTVMGASFLYKGGLLADARVSLLAFAMMYLGFGVIVFWCLTHHPIGQTLSKLSSTQLKWDGGTGILYVVSLTIVGAWTLVDPGFHQRVTSSASPAVGRKGVLISVFFWFLFDVLSITTGLYAIALNPKAQGLDVFPSFGNMVLPEGLKAVFFCGMLGTIISAMVGYTLVSGTTIGREIIARAIPSLTEEQTTNWSKIGVAIACVIAICLGLLITSVVQLWTNWAGAVVGAMLVPVLLAYLSKKPPADRRIVFGAITLAFVVAISWMVYGMTHGNGYLELVLLRTRNGFNIVMPNSANATQDALLANGTKLAVGTLAPSLITCSLVIALGKAFTRKENLNG